MLMQTDRPIRWMRRAAEFCLRGGGESKGGGWVGLWGGPPPPRETLSC